MQSLIPLMNSGCDTFGIDMPYPMPMYQPAQSIKPKFPMPKLKKQEATQKATPLMQLRPNLYAKLEGFQAGGSIKDRAVMQCTTGMLKSGKLKPGDTLCLCTSGNAGRSLLHVQKILASKGIEIKVKIFMPKRYLTRVVPTAIADTEGVDTVQGDRESAFYTIPHAGEMSRFLHGLDGEFMECQEKMSKLAVEHGWAVLDQHHDVNSLHAHESTAKELISQLPSVTDVVCTTGTGGTASGLREYLPAHVTVHARPAKPGAIDGITDVRRYSNFCDVDLLEGFGNNFFDKEESVRNQDQLLAEHNISAGESSGAAFALAKEIMENDPKAQVVFIAADGQTDDETLLQSQVLSRLWGQP
jgi:cysteine synthase A